MTLSTPIYGIKYLGVGEPMRNTRAALQENAESIEAALAAGGMASPDVSDLLDEVAARTAGDTALDTRLDSLEAAQAALGVRQAITYGSGFAQFVSGAYSEAVGCWKSGPNEVRVSGIVNVATATTAGATLTMLTLPTGYRPAITVVRAALNQPGASSSLPAMFRLNVLSTGVVQLVSHVALAIGQWLSLDFAFRTVNT